MKKKTLPILLLLAGLSAAALAGCGHEHSYSWKQSDDGATHWQECECGDKINEGAHKDNNSDAKCDDCGYNLHEHAYEWKSDATDHWKECACGDKISKGTHKDDNNDNKCDDCERAYFAVTFAMHDHGTAPAEQKVVSGGKVKTPDAPANDDAFKFKGWYKDAEYKTAFDFENDTIDAATTLHAKWEEDTTAGASKAYAHELTKDAECLKTAKKGVTYFKYVAEEAGRYTVSLGNGVNSQNATFTTSLTGDAVYGKEHAEEAHFDLEEGDTVYIAYTYLGEEGEDVTAGVIIADTVDEPLPEDHFLDGEYESEDYTYSVTIDRATKKITFDGTAYPFTYVGGSVDSIYFTLVFENGMTENCVVHYDGDGVYSSTRGEDSEAIKVHKYVAPAAPVALSAITGYYEPKDANEMHEGVSKIYIYGSDAEDSTSVLYKINTFYNVVSASYDAKKNRLSFGWNNVASVVLSENNSVAGISVGGKEYVKKAEVGMAPPERIEIDNTSEYIGTTHRIWHNYGSQLFGSGYDAINVTAYDKTTGTYTIVVSAEEETFYKLTVSADSKTITLCNAEGTQIDTLTLFEYIYHEFPVAEKEISIAATDFQKDQVYLFKVGTAGWYAFTGVADGVRIEYNVSDFNPLWGGTMVGSTAVRLAADSIVGVFVNEPVATTFTVAPAPVPVGLVESEPKPVTGGSATITDIMAGTTYYFAYTATEAGAFEVNAFFDEGEVSNSDFVIAYSIDGGKVQNFNDVTASEATTKITVTEGQVVSINVIVGEYQYGKSSVTVNVTKDLWAGATTVTLTGDPEGDEVTVSATVATGSNYYLASTKGEDVTVTGNAAFTVKFKSGAPVTAEEEDGKFTATIPAGAKIYFTIESATQQDVTLSQTFEKGSEGYPVTVSATAGSNTITVEQGETVWFTLPAGQYVCSGLEFVLMDGDVSTGEIITVKAGDVLSCTYQGEEESATLTILEATEIFTAEQAGVYTDEDGTVMITLTTFNSGIYKYSPYAMGTYVTITAGANGTFTFKYFNDALWEVATVSFTFVDGKISIIDSTINDGEALTLEEIVIEGSVTYTGYIGNDYDGAATKLEIAGNVVTYYRDMGEGELVAMMENRTFTESDGTLTFVDSWGTYTITISADGNSVEFVDGELGWSGTLTKEA